MKKFFTLVMALLLMSFFVACGGGEEKSTTPAEKAGRTAKKAAGYQATAVTDGGSISGKVSLAGAVPEKKKLEITKDVNVCGKTGHYDESVVVSADNGIANVVVKIVAIGKGKAMDALGESFTLDQNGCVFQPHINLVPAGGDLTILNSDGILHNIHTYSEKNGSVNVAQPGFKKKMKQNFAKAEIIRVACDVHNWMGGYIVVADHPYYSVTDASGGFELTDVPAGTYTVEFWQETFGKQTQEVTVTAGAAATANAEFAAGS